MRHSRRHERGSALLPVILLSAVLFSLTAASLLFAQNVATTSGKRARETVRFDCSQSGLMLSKSFFQNNYKNWSTYLAAPATYNALQTNFPNPLNINNPAKDPTMTPLVATTFQAAHPELFFDLDGDDKPDVYIYMRDNMDETSTAQDFTKDIDNRVYVGAVCISDTMRPRLANGKLPNDYLISEGLLFQADVGVPCTQAGCGDGTNNLN